MTFEELNIMPSILKALAEEGYTEPTDIQIQAIPPVLEGKDILGSAQTGTGKTAAFAVPILQLLDQSRHTANERGVARKIRALVLTPTRELAMQIYESFCTYGRYTDMRSCVIFGGVSQRPQEAILKRGVDILVATPGRLCDLMSQRLINLQNVEIMTLDEADRMLDMGFSHDVKKIISKTPSKRQTLFFTATMPSEIISMSDSILTNPIKVYVKPEAPTLEAIHQSVYLVDKENKRNLLVHLLGNPEIASALVFTRTKHGADRVVQELSRKNINAQAIHGNKSQNARQMALNDFKNKKTRVLVATDIAARGIDINGLSHVINFDLPEDKESYVHRIGRTGRAGHDGVAISFCDYDEKSLLTAIERLCARPLEVVSDHPYPSALMAVVPRMDGARRRLKHFSSGRR
ncbi:MAG: DEAD/DEAH box helicase [Saccharofermentanales bacterium]